MIANLRGHIAKPGFSTLPVYHGFGHFGVYVVISIFVPRSHVEFQHVT
jgi:hypothetical protein